jgi:predicted PurR-regulated permease PerM
MDNTQRIDRIVAIATAILLTAGCIVVLYPFVSALLWAVILCFVTWPTFLWGVRHLGGRRTLATALMALLVAPFVAVGLSLADNVSHLTTVISQGLEHGPPAPPAWVADIPLVGHRLHTGWQTFGWAIFLALWGLLVVGGADNVIKPYLIGRGSDLPFILVLLGVLGGAMAFGVIGIFLGPTLLAVGYTVVKDWTLAAPVAPAAASGIEQR